MTLAEWLDHPGQCKECGNMIGSTKYCFPTPQKMHKHQVCFTCLFWREICERPAEKRIVVDGCVYCDGGDKPGLTEREVGFMGFGGRRFYIRRGEQVWTTNDLWHNGKVPPHFIGRLPNNAEFLTKEEYEEVT